MKSGASRGAMRLGVILVLAFVAFAGGWVVIRAVAADKDDRKAGNQPAPASVQVAPVRQQVVAPQLTAVGNVIPYQTVALTARLNSQITEVKFKAGDFVEKDAPLFVLDARELDASLGQARAKLAGDQAQLVNLKKEYDRQELGVTKGFASQSARDSAKAAYENQQALVKSDQASIDSLKVQLGYTVVRAPISGRTGTINATLGNVVRANDTVPLVTINQVSPISVEAALPQNSIDAVRTAMAAGAVKAVAVTSAGKTVEGALEYIDNAINTSNGTFAARAMFTNDDETLWPGTLVNLTIALGQGEAALLVPEVAVQHGQQGDFVYVIDGDDTARRRDVKITRMQNGEAVIGEGVDAGERVAVDGIMTIKEDQKVSVSGTLETDEKTVAEPETPGASGLAPATSAPQDAGGVDNAAPDGGKSQ